MSMSIDRLGLRCHLCSRAVVNECVVSRIYLLLAGFSSLAVRYRRASCSVSLYL